MSVALKKRGRKKYRMKNIIKTSVSFIFALGLVFSVTSQAFGASMPVAITYAASGVTSTTATLNGYFNSNGQTTTTFFQYARVAYGGDYDTTARIMQTTASGTFTASLTDLIPNTKYYVRAVAQNSSGKVVATNIVQFRTAPAGVIPPNNNGVTITTGSASLVTSTTADLYGSFSGAGSSSQTYFEYGTSSSSLAGVTSSGNQTTSSGTLSSTLTGLTPNMTYYFRAVIVTNSTTTRASNIMSFTTPGTILNPTCTISNFRSDDYNVDEDETFTLSWVTSGCTYVTISPIVGSASPVSSGSRNVSVDEDTTFTITAGDQFGAIDTDQLDINVYSNNNDDDDDSNATAYSTGASNITATSATLNGRASGYGDSINSWIEFPCWSGNKYDYRTSSGQVTLSHTANNLLSGTTYCYRVGYRTQNGSVYDGVSTTFTTLGTPTWNSWTNNNNNTYTDVYQNPSVIYKTITTKIGGTTNPTRNVFDSYPLGWGNQSFNGSDSNNGNMLGASSFGTGISFLPDTFIGWLLLVIFIMAIVLIARTLMAPKNVGTHH